MFRPALSFPRLALLSLPLLVLVGCSSDPNAPLGSAITSPDTDLSADARPGSTSTGWYPLTLGGLWHYDHELSFIVTPTGGAPGEPVVVRDRVIHDLIRTEELMGRTYVVELQRTEAEGETPLLEFVRYRQDRAGLVVEDPAFVVNHTVMAVSSVWIERDIGQHADLRHRILDCLDRPANEIVGVERLPRIVGPQGGRRVGE